MKSTNHLRHGTGVSHLDVRLCLRMARENRRGRVGECPNANRPCCTRIDKNKKRRFPPPCIKRKLRVLDLCSGTGSVERALLKLIMPDVRAKHRSKNRRGFIDESLYLVSSGDIARTGRCTPTSYSRHDASMTSGRLRLLRLVDGIRRRVPRDDSARRPRQRSDLGWGVGGFAV